MHPERIAALLSPFLGAASLSPTQLEQLSRYLDLLLRWNARINLTAIRDPEQIVARHFGESLFAAVHLYAPGGLPPEASLTSASCSLVDIGSGAGFPGLPIGIWEPGLHTTLLESNQRKSTFLREVVRCLGLAQVDVLTGRAEALAQNISKVGPGARAGAASETTESAAAQGAPPAADLTVTLRAVEHFEDILPIAVKLLHHFQATSRRLGLLIGEAQVAAAHQLAPAVQWSGAIAIPQSAQRVLLIGNLP
ncbi:MAG: 16S rRNA (guanine(527)-N(7))-methyltransferase RsmG [Terriglobales bacterium]